jgi:hypothetical protein
MWLQLLSHPLTLLLVGALLTGIIAPRISKAWQDASLAFQLKVSLVEDIVKATEVYFSRLQLLELQGSNAAVSIDDALAEWRTSYAIIGAKLGTYFHSNTPILTAWEKIGSALWTTYFFLKNDTPKARRILFKQNVGVFPEALDNFETLIDVPILNVGSKVAQYDLELQKLLDVFRFERLALLDSMIESHLRLRPTRTTSALALIRRLSKRVGLRRLGKATSVSLPEP